MIITEKIDTVYELMSKSLLQRGIPGGNVPVIIQDYLDAQLEEKFTHGIGKFLLIDHAIAERKGAPVITGEMCSITLVDGNREIGQVAARFCIDILIRTAGTYGMGCVGLTNASRYSRCATFGRMLAEAGLVGIVFNSAGPPAMVPFNGIMPVLGTNPICFAFPGKDENLVMDFSTSKEVWGNIRQSILENTELKADCFLDKNGNWTKDPGNVSSVVPFGGARGFALGLFIEIFAGLISSAQMGNLVKTQYDTGIIFIAVDPAVFDKRENIYNKIRTLLSEIRNSPGIPGHESPRIPGEQSAAIRRAWLAKGLVPVHEPVLKKLVQMSLGEQNIISHSDLVD